VVEPLGAEYFDGRSARAWPVRLRRDGEFLRIRGDGLDLLVPLREVAWPERTRHGIRVAELPAGASLHCADTSAWDAFARHCGQRDALVVRAQRSWRWILASLAALAVLLAAIYQWGVPMAAQAALAFVPYSMDEALGSAALRSLDQHLLQPSKLAPTQREQLSAAFERALAAQPAAAVPAHHLEFRSSRVAPNAFALPGGSIVLTDELVTLVDGDAAVVTGVLAHELGHLRYRHGMRLLLQVGALGVIASAVFGDFSSLLAAAPALLGQAAYSRSAEREADAESARVLKGDGISPAVMVSFFERLAERDRPESGASAPAHSNDRPREVPGLGIAIASHPADAERIAFFRAAAAQR
jgi:Zn-dependent protease with chaperone function